MTATTDYAILHCEGATFEILRHLRSFPTTLKTFRRSKIMFFHSRRLNFAVLIFSAFLLSAARTTYAQELTKADLALGEEIQSLVLKAKKAFTANRLDESAKQIRLAKEKLIAISATGNSGLVKRLKPSYRVIERAVEELQKKGYTFDQPLPTYSSLQKNTAAVGVANAKPLGDEKIDQLITKGGELFKQQKFQESADHIRDARSQIVKLVSMSDSSMADQYKNNYRRIGKAQKLLATEGYTLDPLPEFDSLLGSGVGSAHRRISNRRIGFKAGGIRYATPRFRHRRTRFRHHR